MLLKPFLSNLIEKLSLKYNKLRVLYTAYLSNTSSFNLAAEALLSLISSRGLDLQKFKFKLAYLAY